MATTLAFDLIANDRASDKFDHLGRSVSSTGDKFRKLGRFAAIGTAALAAGAVVAGKALFDMTKSAIADEKAQAALAQTLRNTAKATDAQIASVESWISAQGVALGVTDDELRPALQRLAEATGDVGKAQKLAAVAMDVSAGTGRSLKSITEALLRAQNGSVSGLSRYGIATKDAAGETLSFNEVVKGMAKTFEGQAATAAETTEGKFKRLQLIFDETKEAIGARLIPVATDLAEWFLAEGLPAMSRFGDWMEQHILPTLQDLGEFIGQKVVPVLQDFAGFIMDHVVPAVGEAFAGALEGVKGFIDNLGDSLEKNRPFLEALGEGLVEIAKFVFDKLGPALAWIYSNVLPALGSAIGGAITVVKTLLSWWLKMGEWGTRAFAYLLDAAMGTFEGILDAAVWGMGWIPGIGDKIRDARDAFEHFRDDTVGKLEDVANKLRDVHERINGLPDREIDITADTNSAARSLDALQTKIDGLHGKSVTVYANVLTSGGKNLGSGGGDLSDLTGGRDRPRRGNSAHGTDFWGGGLTWVGEQGRPELVSLPRGTGIASADKSEDTMYRAFRRALADLPIVRLPDTGRELYAQGPF